MPKTKNKKVKSKKPVKTLNQKLHDWFTNEKVLDNQNEIIGFLSDANNDFDELNYDGVSIIFWSAKSNYKDILTKALERIEAAQVINRTHPNEYDTALSISTYFGYHEIVSLLLGKNASIEVIDTDNTCINAYEALGLGYWRWPTDVEDYKKAFKTLVTKDPAKPNRKFFHDRYNLTKDKAYLACLRLYDQVHSGMKDKKNQSYRQRDILAVEDAAARRFFRFNKPMRDGGIAKALEVSLFAGQSIPIDGYAARTVIIALVSKMQRTASTVVQTTVNHKGNFCTDPNKKIFSVRFTLGATQLLYEWRPQRWQRGNCVLKVNGNVPDSFGDGIANFLENLTNSGSHNKCNNRTKQLGKLFLEKTKQLQPFRHYEFTYRPTAPNKLIVRTSVDNAQGKAVATLSQVQTMIHKLNGLLILWSIAEPARRLSGHQTQNAIQIKKSAVNLDHIPVATMQIRALQLLSEGIIALRDIFGRSKKYAHPPYNHPDHKAKYGVSTGKNLAEEENFSIVKEKAMRLADLGLPHAALASKMRTSWFSRNCTKQMLRDGYGSADESSDEDYSDDDLPQAFIP